jgi:hypothetical protein
MDWHRIWCLLEQLPDYQKIIVALIFLLGLPFMIRKLVLAWVSGRIENARETQEKIQRLAGVAGKPVIASDVLISTSKPWFLPRFVWRWFSAGIVKKEAGNPFAKIVGKVNRYRR